MKFSQICCCSLTFLQCFVGGNFCAGYDLKGLACNPTLIKLEQHVTKGPGPMVCAWKYNSPVRRGFWQVSETKLDFHGQKLLQEHFIVLQLLCSLCLCGGVGEVAGLLVGVCVTEIGQL